MPVEVFETSQALMQSAAQDMARLARRAASGQGVFSVALSGGSTPMGAYRLLGRSPLADAIPWGKAHLFWGDERCLPPEHAQSNFGQAMEALGRPPGLAQDNLHRIPAEDGPERGAELYREELARFFGPDQTPVFDLVLLGLGGDGHVASLFPGSVAAKTSRGWVLPVEAPTHMEPKVPRVSLGFEVILAARRVWLLAVGPGKADIVARVLQGGDESLPARQVLPSDKVSWFLDQASAGKLR